MFLRLAKTTQKLEMDGQLVLKLTLKILIGTFKLITNSHSVHGLLY